MVEPPPSQQPHPPFWVAAGSEASIRRAAQRGFNLILDQYASPEVIGQRIALYRAERQASGHSAGPARIAVARQAYVANDRADAEAALQKQAAWTQAHRRGVARAGRQDRLAHPVLRRRRRKRTEANALYGTPDEICRTLAGAASAGVEYVILTLLGGQDQLRRFARDVMPAFADRRRIAARSAAKLAPFGDCRISPLASATFP